jgi:methyl-accepting chemotaxis protein
MKDLRIGVRLAIGFGFALVMMAIVAVLGISRMAVLADEVELMTDDRYPKTVWANDMVDSLNLIARAQRNALLVSQAETGKELARVAEARKIIDDRMGKLDQSILSEAGKEQMRKVKAARAAYVPLQEKFIELIQGDLEDEAKVLMLTKLRTAQADYLKAVTELIAFQSKLMTDAGKEATASYKSARVLMIASSLMALIVTLFFALWITRSITRPLAHASAAAGALAGGDLTVDIEAQSKDETGVLMDAMHRLVTQLNQIIGEVKWCRRRPCQRLGSGLRHRPVAVAILQRTSRQSSKKPPPASNR